MEREKLISLVSDAQAGDGSAMNELFNAFYNDVYFFALKTCGDEDSACEVTQETFIEIINTIGNLKEPAAFVTWMKQITYHQCTGYFKKQKSREKYVTLAEENEDGVSVLDFAAEDRQEFIPDQAVDQKEFRQTILSMLDQLSPEHRSAMMLYYYDEMSVKQIAQIQQVSESAVKSRLFHGRKFIKKSVEDYEKKNNIKLHSFGLFPLFIWLFHDSQKMAGGAVTVMAAEITAATGTAVAMTASTAAGTAAATGLTALLAAVPMSVKVAASALVLTLAAGGVAMVTNQPAPQPTQPTQAVVATMPAQTGNSVSTPPETTLTVTEPVETTIPTTEPPETTIPTTEPVETTIPTTEPVETTVPTTEPVETTIPTTEPTETTIPTTEPPETTVPTTDPPETEPIVSGYSVPDGCTYTTADGTSYNPGEVVPEATSGDTLLTADYTYTYSSSGWAVKVNDKSKTSYESLLGEINGKKLTNMTTAFALCQSMKTAPVIPYGVVTMHGAFYGCSALSQTPDIPGSVTSLNSTFATCSSLIKVSEIPSSVVDMTGTFSNCKSLSGQIIIHASPTSYDKCFASTVQPITLTGSSTMLNELAATSGNGNVTVG